MSVAERQRAIERLERSRTRQRRSEENSAAEGFAGETRQVHTPERSDKNVAEDHLAMLTALRDQGILTEKQFEVAKIKAEKKKDETKAPSINSASNGADTNTVGAETCTADTTSSVAEPTADKSVSIHSDNGVAKPVATPVQKDLSTDQSETEDIFGELLSNLDAEMDADFGEKTEDVNGTELKQSGEPSVDLTGELIEMKNTIADQNETKDTIAETNETEKQSSAVTIHKDIEPPTDLLEENAMVDSTEEGKAAAIEIPKEPEAPIDSLIEENVEVVDSTEEGKAIDHPPQEAKKEIPEEFLGNWTLVEKDHTHNFDEFLKANDINWALRKLVIAMMGNTFQFGIHRIDGGMGYIQLAPATDPKDLMWTYQFDEETINLENKKKQYTCTLDMTDDGKVFFTECPDNPKYKKNITLSINDQGIMIVHKETNGAVLERRMRRMADV